MSGVACGGEPEALQCLTSAELADYCEDTCSQRKGRSDGSQSSGRSYWTDKQTENYSEIAILPLIFPLPWNAEYAVGDLAWRPLLVVRH